MRKMIITVCTSKYNVFLFTVFCLNHFWPICELNEFQIRLRNTYITLIIPDIKTLGEPIYIWFQRSFTEIIHDSYKPDYYGYRSIC